MNRHKFYWWLLLSFVFVIPLNQQLSIKILLALLLLSPFLNLNFNRLFLNSWDVEIYFLILIIGIFHSTDTAQGLRELETSFSLFAAPIIFSALHPLKEPRLHTILTSFILGLVVACLICVAHATISFQQTGSIESFFFYQFTDILDFQPTYFAYFLCFGISVALYFLHYKKSKFPNWILSSLTFFFFVILMLTSGRTTYIALLLVFSFFILKFLFGDNRNVNVWLSFLISSGLLICMLLINSFDAKANYDLLVSNNDYWERLALWKSGLLANTNLLFGVGTGDYKIALNHYYLNNGLAHYAKESFNTHNQFIQLFLTNGLLGVLFLFLLLGRPLYLSIKYQNVLGIMTFFSFFIYGITEVFLGRYQGVVFFAFLSQVFISHYSLRDTPSGLQT